MLQDGAAVIDMERVTPREFWAYLDKWKLVTSVSKKMLLANAGGRYYQTGYFSVLGIVGTKMVPDMTNIIGAMRRAPTKSHGRIGMTYFINRNATHEKD